jgi:DNA-binding IclR family transcriptional regulator
VSDEPDVAPRAAKLHVQVIARAASVLRALENERDGLSLGALAKRVGLPRSTVQRIVSALESESLVIAATPTGGVRLGPTLLRLAASVETSAALIAKPYMASLSREIGETVDLSALARDHAVIIEQCVGAHRIYVMAAIAVHFPLHSTANGKAMLALLSDAEIIARIGRSYERRTPNTLTTYRDLLADIRTVRRTGVAYGNEENAPGVCAIGVAFKDAHGNCLAISMPIPRPRFDAIKTQVAERLLEIKSEIRSRIGAS